ncbi:ABC transporter permease [Aquisalimonas asiatica]|nr:ABC transporter permease [Aquisalimonas asiatica]
MFVFTPIIANLVFSFNASRFPTLPLAGFTTHWYEEIFSDRRLIQGLKNSLLVSGTTALIATFLGFSAAYIDYRYRFFGRTAFLALVTLPPTIPVVILGLGMLSFQSSVGLLGTIPGIVSAHVVYCAPFALALTRMRLASLDPSIEPAAWNLGATQGSTMLSIIIPHCAPAILAAFFLTAAVSFDEFMIAYFISGYNQTLPVHVLTMLEGQVSPRVNAIGSVVFLFTIGMVVLAQVLMVRRRHS